MACSSVRTVGATWHILVRRSREFGSFAEVENLERAKGIEPSIALGEVAVLHLNSARKPLKLFGIQSPLRPKSIDFVWFSKSAISFSLFFSLSSRGPAYPPP